LSGYLIDTDVLSETIRPRPSKTVLAWFDALDEEMTYVSVLVLAEIEQGIARLSDRERVRRAKLEPWLAALRVEFTGRTLPVTDAIASRFGRLSGAALRSGVTLPVLDGLIGATTIEHDLQIATRNRHHIEATGARVFDPFADGLRAT
jgi:toxin FitB